METGYLYLICSDPQDAGKLGWATSPRDRLVKAQTDNPSRLTLFGIIPASRAVEGELHAALVGLRIRGEWFKGLDRLEAIFRELEDKSGAREFDGKAPALTVEDVKQVMLEVA
jgi:hypothetical protein